MVMLWWMRLVCCSVRCNAVWCGAGDVRCGCAAVSWRCTILTVSQPCPRSTVDCRGRLSQSVPRGLYPPVLAGRYNFVSVTRVTGGRRKLRYRYEVTSQVTSVELQCGMLVDILHIDMRTALRNSVVHHRRVGRDSESGGAQEEV